MIKSACVSSCVLLSANAGLYKKIVCNKLCKVGISNEVLNTRFKAIRSGYGGTHKRHGKFALMCMHIKNVMLGSIMAKHPMTVSVCHD